MLIYLYKKNRRKKWKGYYYFYPSLLNQANETSTFTHFTQFYGYISIMMIEMCLFVQQPKDLVYIEHYI